MQSFFSRLSRPSRTLGPIQAPPARGQAQVYALLNPNAISSDELDDFVQVIQAADPQYRRGRGIIGRARPSPAPPSPASPFQGIDVTHPFTPETGSTEINTEPIHSTNQLSDSESSWALSPPASLLVEGAASNESSDNTNTPPEGGCLCSSYASSYSNSPGSQGLYHPPQWDLLQNLEAAIAAAEYDSDASTLVGSMYATSIYDDDASEVDIGDLAVNAPYSHHNSTQGNPGAPGAESSVFQVPGNEGD